MILRLWSFFFWSRSPRIPQQPQSVFEGAHFLSLNKFPSLVCWCIVIHHHRPQGPTLLRRVRWDFTCVQCDVCTDTGPPVLCPIPEDYVMYSKFITLGDCSRLSAGSGNRTSAPVQALDHKSNSLPLGYRACIIWNSKDCLLFIFM